MQKQTVDFVVRVKNGVVQEIGIGFIFHPKTNYSGGSFKWYEDKEKQKASGFPDGSIPSTDF